MSATLLRVEQAASGYGDVHVLRGVSFSVDTGELACIIGSNGAGKTTLMRTLAGLNPLFAGRMEFAGLPIGGLDAPAIAARGLVLVPEGRRLFGGMNVRDNLLLGAYLRQDGHAAIGRSLDEVFELFPRLAERRRQDAMTLSGGEQQMCAIARGLMARPRLLLVDELSLGLAPQVVDELVETLQRINAGGVTLLVVEQDVGIALGLARRGFILDLGRITLEGESSELLRHPAIGAAYLGIEAEPGHLI